VQVFPAVFCISMNIPFLISFAFFLPLISLNSALINKYPFAIFQRPFRYPFHLFCVISMASTLIMIYISPSNPFPPVSTQSTTTTVIYYVPKWN
jgi:hypothetical protein